MNSYGTKRKFEVVIETDPYDEHEPLKKIYASLFNSFFLQGNTK